MPPLVRAHGQPAQVVTGSHGAVIITPLNVLAAPFRKLHLGPTLFRCAGRVAVAVTDGHVVPFDCGRDDALDAPCAGLA